MLRNTLITLSDSNIGVDNNADNRADFYTASVLSATDYYAFGMSMKERSWQSESYRYGFNGKENDTDWDVQDYGFRIYKPELGKFLSVDPLSASYPWYTPYQFAGNKPIQFIDLDGAEEKEAIYKNTGNLIVLFNAGQVEILRNEDKNFGNKNWDYIYAKNIEEATKMAKNYASGSSINNLVIRNHGSTSAVQYNDGYTVPMDELYLGLDAKMLSADDLIQKARGEDFVSTIDKVVAENLLEMSALIQGDGNFILTNCNCGANKTGDDGNFARGFAEYYKSEKKADIHFTMWLNIGKSGQYYVYETEQKTEQVTMNGNIKVITPIITPNSVLRMFDAPLSSPNAIKDKKSWVKTGVVEGKIKSITTNSYLQLNSTGKPIGEVPIN